MTDARNQQELEARLWKEIGRGRTGMLGLVGDRHQHFQPMTAFPEEEDGTIWFFTRLDTDLARAVASEPGDAMFIIMTKDQELQACIGGTLVQDHDATRIEKYWGPVVSAWYPDGKEDPNLALLRFDCRDAQVWLSEAGPVKFAWEIVRANLSDRKPDLGDQGTLELR
jgi:general stress protein 26